MDFTWVRTVAWDSVSMVCDVAHGAPEREVAQDLPLSCSEPRETTSERAELDLLACH